MDASLEEFIEEKEKEVEENNTPEPGEHENQYGSISSSVSYNKEIKWCPSCTSRCEKGEGRNRFYECTNDDCGVLEFNCGFYEWLSTGHDDGWLRSVEWDKV